MQVKVKPNLGSFNFCAINKNIPKTCNKDYKQEYALIDIMLFMKKKYYGSGFELC